MKWKGSSLLTLLALFDSFYEWMAAKKWKKMILNCSFWLVSSSQWPIIINGYYLQSTVITYWKPKIVYLLSNWRWFGFSFVAISSFTLSYCDRSIGFHIEIMEIISFNVTNNMFGFPFLLVFQFAPAESFNDFKFWIRNLEPKPSKRKHKSYCSYCYETRNSVFHCHRYTVLPSLYRWLQKTLLLLLIILCIYSLFSILNFIHSFNPNPSADDSIDFPWRPEI